MICENPFVRGRQAFPCGDCLPCRYKRRRQWCARITLEALQHGDNAFVTLTYHSKNLRTPSGHYVAVGTRSEDLPGLHPKDLQDFIKRLRKAIAPLQIRFFGVGEYGDETERPHYHLALFGYPSCRYGMSRYSKANQNCCSACDLIAKEWGLGNTFVGTLDAASVKYIAGYTVKKMNAKSVKLEGRHPEFARMSLRPGVGYDGLHELADKVMKYDFCDKHGDVPFFLGQGRGKMPLGRYLRSKLRRLCGNDEKTPAEILLKWQAELLALSGTQEIAFSKIPAEAKSAAIKNGLIEYGVQAARNMKARDLIFKQRRKL